MEIFRKEGRVRVKFQSNIEPCRFILQRGRDVVATPSSFPFKRSRNAKRSLKASLAQRNSISEFFFPFFPSLFPLPSSKLRIRDKDKPQRFEKLGLVFFEMNDRHLRVRVFGGMIFFNRLSDSGTGRVEREGSVMIFPSTGWQRKINESPGFWSKRRKKEKGKYFPGTLSRFEVLHLFFI